VCSSDLDHLRALTSGRAEVEVAAGQLLIERGAFGAGLYVIVDGSAVVELKGRTRELSPGSVVGERALLSPDGLRTARVRARTDLRVVAVPRSELERLCAEDPHLCEQLARSLG